MMPLIPPIADQEISASGFGIPITTEVNRLTTETASLDTRLDAEEAATFALDGRLDVVEANIVIGAWQTPGLINAWVQLGAPRPTTQYRKRHVDLLDIRVAVSGGGNGAPIFVLAVGFRPPNLREFMCRCGSGQAVVNISSDGNVTVFFAAPADNSLVSFSMTVPLT
jgi:hypothetical protein